jgi:hypothetical protein
VGLREERGPELGQIGTTRARISRARFVQPTCSLQSLLFYSSVQAGAQSQSELQVLIDPRLREVLTKYNVRLLGFSFLCRSTPHYERMAHCGCGIRFAG